MADCVYVCVYVLCARTLSLAAAWTQGVGAAAALPLLGCQIWQTLTQTRLLQRDIDMNPYLLACLQRSVPSQAPTPGWPGGAGCRQGSPEHAPEAQSCSCLWEKLGRAVYISFRD